MEALETLDLALYAGTALGLADGSGCWTSVVAADQS